MKKIIKPIIIIALLILICIILYKYVNNDSININDQGIPAKKVVTQRLGQRKDKDLILNTELFKSYDEYTTFMNNYDASLKLSESDFKDNDYILEFQASSKCSEQRDKEVGDIEVTNSVMTITYKVYNKCATCEDEEKEFVAYFIAIKKGTLKGLLPVNNKMENVNANLECK